MDIVKEYKGGRRDFKEANLEGADLEGAVLKGANLEGAVLKWAILEGANLEGAVLKGANLEGAVLKWAILEGANLEGANLEGADLEGANLKRADLEGADLEGAVLKWAKGISVAGPMPTSGRMIYFVKHQEKIMVQAGCFWRDIEELKSRVEGSHNCPVYLANIELVKKMWGGGKFLSISSTT